VIRRVQQSLASYVRRGRYRSLFRPIGYAVLLSSLVLTAKNQDLKQSRPLPLGSLIDVGGYRVHVYCTGQGSPTVMIVGAAFSFDWGLVQPEVAKFTRVCTFDPSGTAWSDPFRNEKPPLHSQALSSSSVPQTSPTCSDRVEEIHRMIAAVPITGPYVLVGLSVGALWERLYAAKYPDRITGLVIVDHAFLGESKGKGPPHAAIPSHSSRGYSAPVLLSTVPITLGFEDDVNFSKLPKSDQELHKWAISQDPIRPGPKMAADCFSLIDKVTAGRAYPLGDTPLWVINTANEAPGYRALQAKLLALSRRSEQAIAWNSTHMVPIDQPEVITKVIHQAVFVGQH